MDGMRGVHRLLAGCVAAFVSCARRRGQRRGEQHRVAVPAGRLAGSVYAGLSTTVYSPTQQPLKVEHPQAVKNPKIDCFYVYPTVSNQPGPLANLSIDPEERSIALYEAARYSQYCRVFAPMYRQVTVPALRRARRSRRRSSRRRSPTSRTRSRRI